MTTMLTNRYFEPENSSIARELYDGVQDLPLICPHGHVDPRLLADPNYQFGTPVDLLIIPDHYIFRMLYSQGISLESLGIPRLDKGEVERDHRKIWQTVCDHWYLFRGTPTGVWLRDELRDVFGIEPRSTARTRRRSMMRLLTSSVNRNFAHAPCSSASKSRCWQRPTPRPIRLNIIRRFATPAGAGG